MSQAVKKREIALLEQQRALFYQEVELLEQQRYLQEEKEKVQQQLRKHHQKHYPVPTARGQCFGNLHGPCNLRVVANCNHIEVDDHEEYEPFRAADVHCSEHRTGIMLALNPFRVRLYFQGNLSEAKHRLKTELSRTGSVLRIEDPETGGWFIISHHGGSR